YRREPERSVLLYVSTGSGDDYRLQPAMANWRNDLSFDDAHDVRFLHDQQVFAVDLDLGAAPLAKQHAVAGLHVRGDVLAIFVAGTGAYGDDHAFRRLFLGGVGDDDPAFGLFFAV